MGTDQSKGKQRKARGTSEVHLKGNQSCGRFRGSGGGVRVRIQDRSLLSGFDF